MKKLLPTLLLTGAIGLSASAATIKQWDFNSLDFDGLIATGTLRPNNGVGYPAESVGGVANSYGNVSVVSGSSDPNTLDNSHWRLGTVSGADGFPEQGTANKTAGAQFRVNTSGYQNLSVTWDQENSATASRYWRVQYTTNGVDWLDQATVITANSIGNPDPDTGTPTWQLGLTADFTTTPGVNNNPNFGFRLVSEFESTATGSGAEAYVANRATANYGTAGTLWLDMVTVSGDDLDPANQWPQISAIADQTTLRGEATPALALTVSDVETTADNLLLSASSSNPTLVNTFNFGGSAENRTIVVVPEANQTGVAIITVRVLDQGGKTSETSFLLTVVEPAISQIFSQFTTWDAPITVPFIIHNLPGDPAGWTISGGSSDTSKIASSGIEFGGSGVDRTVTLTPQANAIGDTVITITASTTGWQATTNFLVRLLPDFVVEYDVSGLPNSPVASAPATRVDPGLVASDLTRGPGIAASSLTSGFAANRWNNPNSAHEPSSPSRENALTRGDYFEFSVTVEDGVTVSLATLDASMRRSALNAAFNFEWQYSLDGFATPGVTILPEGPIWDQLGWTESFYTFRGRTSGTLPPDVPPYSWMVQDSPGQPNLVSSPGYPIPPIDLSGIAELQAINGPKTVTFRLYGWGNNSTADSNTTALGRLDGPRIRGTFAMLIGALILPSGDLFYGVGQAGLGIDGRASIVDATASYNGATLTVELTSNGTADDRLEIRNTGTGAGEISVSGNTVSLAGTAIATFTGGIGTTPLVVTFNSASTPASAEALLRNITFRNVNSSPVENRRAVSVVLERSDGFTTSATTGIRVSQVRYADFQEGADRGYGLYSGQADVELFETDPSTPFPMGHSGAASSPRMWIDARTAGTVEEAQALLRFDNIVGTGPGQIPPGATVVSADLILNVVDPGDGSPLYRMLTAWDAETATWDSFGGGLQPDDLEARSAFDSQLGVALIGGGTDFGRIAIGVTADVQAWVNGAANHGWGMTSWDQDLDPTWGRGTDGLAFNPSETPAVEDRPRLRVLWVPAGTLEASFRQDVDGYTSARDTRVRAEAPEEEGSTLASVFVDWTGSTDHVLIRFDDIIGNNPGQIPPGANIQSAMLDLATVVNNGYGDGGQFFAMLTPWDDTNTWNVMVDGISADGVEAAATPTTVAGTADLIPNVCGGFMSFDVTPDVQVWANGTRANFGWAILPWDNGGDGWGISTSESVEERERPRLRVFYTPGAPVAPSILMQPPVVSPSSVQINFSGAPTTSYHVLRAPTVTGPWTTNGTVVTAANGNGVHTDNAVLPGGAFYRVFQP